LGFTAFTGSEPAGWTANGSAVYDSADNAAQLTDLNNWEAGSWVYGNSIRVDTMRVIFDFYSGGGGSGGADGMGFMLETDGNTALGGSGGALGMAGLTGFGLEIDEWNNGECMDTTANHLGIDLLTPCGAGEPTTLAANNSPGITVSDGNWHTITLDIVEGAFTVTADGYGEFAAYAPAGWSDGSYYLGFAGATGGGVGYHRVRNVAVGFTTPHCF
jgi:hypothetical protein